MSESAPFKFNFMVDDGIPVGDEDSDNKIENEKKASLHSERYIQPAEELDTSIPIRLTEEEFDELPLPNGIVLWKMKNSPEVSVIKDVGDNTDLVPGKYEGGFKIWECSIDLCEYIIHMHNLKKPASEKPLNGQRVIELGCGHGLPGVLCALHGAKVVFQDYNKEVLELATRKTLLRNVGQKSENELVQYISGDWSHTSSKVAKHSFDLILTAETVYEPETIPYIYGLFKHCLKREGMAIVSAKVYYFGVGGGIQLFEDFAIKDDYFHIEHTKTYDDGASNMREILVLRVKEQ